MKNLRLLLAALAVFAFTANAQAQDKLKLTDAQKQERKAHFEENKKRLALTPEQETPYKEISKKYHEEMKAIRKSEGDRQEKFKKLSEVRDRKNNAIKGILSEKQYQTYLEIQQERKLRMKDKRKED